MDSGTVIASNIDKQFNLKACIINTSLWAVLITIFLTSNNVYVARPLTIHNQCCCGDVYELDTYLQAHEVDVLIEVFSISFNIKAT